MTDGSAGTEVQSIAVPPLRRRGTATAARVAPRRLLTRVRVFRAPALVMAATLAWHASNFTFNVVAARGLTASDYGDLAAAIALLYIVSPLFVSVQTVSSRLTTELATKGRAAELRGLLRYYAVRLAFFALVLAAALALASPALAQALHINGALPLVVIAASLPLAVTVHVQRGLLQGTESFGRFALSTAAEATTKVAFAVILVTCVWPTVTGAVLGVAAGLLAALGVNAILLRFLPRGARTRPPVSHPYRYSLATLGSLSFLALLLSLDVVAAKRFLPPQQAGLYAAVALAGKVVFFATSGVNWIVFPRFSRMIDAGEDARPLLRRGFLLIAAVGAAFCAAYFSDPHPFVAALFGHRYPTSAHYLGWIAVAYAGYCIAYLGGMYLLAARSTRGIVVLGAAVLAQVTGFCVFHAGVGMLVAVQASVLCGAALAIALLCTSDRVGSSSRGA